MIKSIIICNCSGKPRLIKFYDESTESEQQAFLRETYELLHKRSNRSCNFLEIKDSEYRVIYRQYSTIYVIFCIDLSESELGVLDLIQVFVDLLDRTFENVCELDIIFNSDKVHFLLNELVCGGIVLETNCAEILRRMQEQDQIGKLSSETSTHTSIRNSSNISTKLLSGVKVGSSFIASVVPSTLSSAREWASQLSASAPSLRISNRTGFRDLKNDPTFHSTSTDTEETEKICL
ncbi:unnamed protein product [Rodentolepis nana]|uniref:Clat_adaptor_s domain-containing protein n=1 Tax=Rodentolepis nana TaxID=102285 RepID=A0A0R3TQ15_RODNA|nr:unnamed protein product [Rodentolepis nana]